MIPSSFRKSYKILVFFSGLCYTSALKLVLQLLKPAGLARAVLSKIVTVSLTQTWASFRQYGYKFSKWCEEKDIYIYIYVTHADIEGLECSPESVCVSYNTLSFHRMPHSIFWLSVCVLVTLVHKVDYHTVNVKSMRSFTNRFCHALEFVRWKLTCYRLRSCRHLT